MLIEDQPFFDQPVKNKQEVYEKINKKTEKNGYTGYS